MSGYNSVIHEKKELKHIKIEKALHRKLTELKQGNDTFSTVIERLLAISKARILSEEDKLLTFGKEEKAPFKIVRNTEYREEDRNLGRGDEKGDKGSEKVLIR